MHQPASHTPDLIASLQGRHTAFIDAGIGLVVYRAFQRSDAKLQKKRPYDGSP